MTPISVIQVKSNRAPSSRDSKGMRTLMEAFPKQAPFGILLYPGTDTLPLGDRVVAVPMAGFLAGA